MSQLFDDRPEFLKPGMKSSMIFELCKMCYFEYEIYEQWTNEGVDAEQLTPENPPKVTRYRHNEKWHIDKIEGDSDGDTSDEEDMEARGGNVSLKALAQHSKTRADSREATRRLSSGELQEEKKASEEDERPQVFSMKKSRKGTVRTMKRSPHSKTNRDMRSESPGSRSGSPERPRSGAGSPPLPACTPPKLTGSPERQSRRRSTAIKEFSTEPGSRTSVWQKKKVWTIEYLKISKGRKMSAADIRRDELRRKRAEEARAAEEARKAWLALSRRMRGLIVGCTARVNGRLLTAMCYEFKQQLGMYKINLVDILGGGGVYEIKVSASVLGKQLGIKRRVSKWSKEQKRTLLTQWLRGTKKHRLVPPKGGRPEVEHVYDEPTALMKSRVVWRHTGRIGVNGPHLKEADMRVRAPRHRNVVQVPTNVTGPLLATDPMMWERRDWKGGEVRRVRELRHPYKKVGKTVVLDDETPQSSRPGTTSRPGTRDSAKGKDDGQALSSSGGRRKSKDGGKKGGDKKKKEEEEEEKSGDEKGRKSRGRSRGNKKGRPKSGGRSGSRSKSKGGRPNSRSKSREERRKKRESKSQDFFQNQYEEDADELAQAKREAEMRAKADFAAEVELKKERLREIEEREIAERVAEHKAKMDIEEREAEEERRNPKFVAFAKSPRDFAWSRAKDPQRGFDLKPKVKEWVVDTVRGTEGEDDKWFLSSAHAAAYCPRKFFQLTTSILGQNFHKKTERRGRSCFRIGCKPRREVGRGKRLVSGVAKVDDLRGIYEVYRSGKGTSWDSNSGEGDGIKLFFTVVSEIMVGSRYEKKMVKGDCFRLDLTIDDLYRCCRDTGYMETAMMGDDEFLIHEKASQADNAKALKQQEADALKTCQEELAKAKKLAAKVRLTRKEKVSERSGDTGSLNSILTVPISPLRHRPRLTSER